MRPTSTLLVLVALTATACFPIIIGNPGNDEPDAGTVKPACWGPTAKGATKLADDATVRIIGKVLHEDGSRGCDKVALIRPQTLGDFFWNIASLGLFCLSGNLNGTETAKCESLHTATLDAQGNYVFTMTASETRSDFLGLKSPYSFRFVGAAPKAAGQVTGAWLETEISTDSAELDVPDLRLWEPALALSISGGKATVGFSSAMPWAPECYDLGPLSLILETPKGERLWSQPVSAGQAVDTRLFEDWQGGATVAVTMKNRTSSAYLTLGTAKVSFTGTSAPVSRGATCSVGAQVYAGADCAISDGDIKSGLYPGQGDAVVLDLGAAKPISFVVLRGEMDGAPIEASLDNSSWTALGKTDGFTELAPPAGTTARYLRVKTPGLDGGYSTTGLSVLELSVW